MITFDKSGLDELREKNKPELTLIEYIDFLKKTHKVTVLNRQNSSKKRYAICEDALEVKK